jgi:hypothetical protein
VEDRLTPALYLEMTSLGAEEYAGARVPDVLRAPGAQRATWWENVVPGRTDMRRRLPEFAVLGVYEVATGFTPPVAPEGITGLLFHRYPRPAQGRLTGRPTIGLSLVLITPKDEERTQALRDWADFVHISEIAAAGVPGFTMITPFERVGGDTPRFMHFYEMDTDDPEAAFKAMPGLVQERLGAPGTAAFDEWAWHPALWIDYVNSFRRLGLRRA